MPAPRRASGKPPARPTITTPTARFLLGILDGLTLTVGAEDFDQAASAVLRARAELRAMLSPTITQASVDASPTT